MYPDRTKANTRTDWVIKYALELIWVHRYEHFRTVDDLVCRRQYARLMIRELNWRDVVKYRGSPRQVNRNA